MISEKNLSKNVPSFMISAISIYSLKQGYVSAILLFFNIQVNRDI